MVDLLNPDTVKVAIKMMELGGTVVVALGSIYLLLEKGIIPLRERISEHTQRVGELITKVVDLIEKQEENHTRQMEQQRKNHQSAMNQIKASEERIKDVIKKTDTYD